MTIGEFQFCASAIMGMLSASLVIASRYTNKAGKIYNKSLWILTTGTILLTVHFGLQYYFKFRSNGQMEECVFLNILLVQPAAWLISLSVLYLLRNGHVRRWEYFTGFLFYIVSLAVILASYLSNEKLLSLHHSEIAASAIYGSMLLFLYLQEFNLIRHLNMILDNFYDSRSKEMTRWIKNSVSLLAILALFSPIFIFMENAILLTSYAFLILFFVFYYAFNFICFGISENASMLSRASEDEEKEEIILPTKIKDNSKKSLQRVELAIKKWMLDRGHMKTGITIQDAVDEMGIPRYLLVQWIKNTEYEVFSKWIAHLRVEEAKQLMTAHPDYSNEAVAKECGFSSRSYFQKVFRDLTGMTPREFQSQCNKNATP